MMRCRVVNLAAVCAILGAFTSIGIATVAACLPARFPRYWVNCVGPAPLRYRLAWRAWQAVEASRSVESGAAGSPDDDARLEWAEWRLGWPARCLSARQESQPNMGLMQQSGVLVLPFRSNDPFINLSAIGLMMFDQARTLTIATHVRVLGLAVDTAFWGSAWAAVLLVPAAVRRWRRKGTGGCHRCGYERRGLPDGARCPECGTIEKSKDRTGEGIV